MPKGCATRSNSWPMPPAPTMPSVRPTRPVAHVVGALGPLSCARETVLRKQPAGQRKEHREGGHRDRAPNGERRIGDDDPARGHRGYIDRVVADAVARKNLHPAVAACNRFARYLRRIHIQSVVARGKIRRHLTNRRGQVLPLERRIFLQHLERAQAERGHALRIEHVAGDAELERHAVFSRSGASVRPIAACSSVWSRPAAIMLKPNSR